MSAYVVEDEVINQVVNWLSQGHGNDHLRRKILREIEFNLGGVEGCEALGNAMFKLNCDAVEQRYSDSKASEFRNLDYRFIPQETLGGGMIIVGAPVSIMQIYKALACWLYQCAEGTCDETPLSLTMASVHADIAHSIVRALPEYDKAGW